MKRIISIIMAAAMLISLTACGKNGESTAQDNSPISMLITTGNSEAYYKALAEKIESQLGIDVEFVYQVSGDTTDMQRLYFAHNDLPTDIIFTASKTDDALLKDSCVDLLSRSSVTALYTPATVQGCTTEDGAIYQLPVSSKLIGITYNETLLNEMGWSVPKSFNDMLDLKEKCDEAGIKFAVSDGAATGHGFNWLFHLMGAEWLSTTEGTEWFEGFQNGTRSVDEFKSKCDYFKKWTEAGLWGSFHNQDWNGSQEFSRTRALFWFGLTNSVTGYDGPQYDDNGNETGKTLSDTYKTIPWISESGDNNCYTYYDNCWVYLNKSLEAPDKADKLKKAVKILEFLTTDDATQLVSDISRDNYVSVSNYEMGSDRLYADYRDSVKRGFVQPWYYNEFDMDSIVFTGEQVNAYISGTGNYDDIFTTLDKYNQQALNSKTESLADFPDGLDMEETAKLLAIAGAAALDKTLEENGIADRVSVTIAPYTRELNQLQPWKAGGVSNSFVYTGSFDASMVLTLVPNGVKAPVGIYMTGAEIKAITEKGFDLSDTYIDAETGESTFDSEHYGPYPYVCVVKDGAELADEEEYLVALSGSFITSSEYASFSDAGKVLSELENVYSYSDGIKLFAAEHPQITAEERVW